MESGFTINAKYSIKDYQFNLKRENVLLFILFYFICRNYDYSLNLSRDGKKESKKRMECAYSTNAKYSIKDYQFAMKRESN